MLDFLKGRRPDITAAQIGAVAVAGVPGVATLLTAFGVADIDAAQQEALSGALTWSALLAAVLIGGDATLRATRNLADAKTDAADEEEFFADSELERLEAGLTAENPDYVSDGR